MFRLAIHKSRLATHVYRRLVKTKRKSEKPHSKSGGNASLGDWELPTQKATSLVRFSDRALVPRSIYALLAPVGPWCGLRVALLLDSSACFGALGSQRA